jgi:outer membrane receptor for Fe3+-dicitrate
LDFSIEDYTQKSVDPIFGFATLIERDYSKQNKYRVEVPNNMYDEVNEVLADLRGTWTLFVGTRRFTSAYVYGYFSRFNNSVTYQDTSILTLEIEGIT